MAAEGLVQANITRTSDEPAALANQWRALNRWATLVALVTSPALFLSLHEQADMSVWASLLLTLLAVAAFRGLVDVVARRMIPWPNLFGAEQRLLAEDVVARRRAWYWRKRYRLAVALALLVCVVWVVRLLTGRGGTPIDALGATFGSIGSWWQANGFGYLIQMLIFLLINVVILIGPFLMLAVRQIRAYEPGDADWGVKLDDVRGQDEAKEEIRRVITLWQSGEAFERAGGKRERGLLFLGPPGTGKTMLAKAIATGFNCPFVTVPGSGFAGMFIGMDVLSVQYLAWKAKRLAAKWGGQCIVFIDEIDAVGMRRSALAGASMRPPSLHDLHWHGAAGSLSSTCNLVMQTPEWGARLSQRLHERPPSAAAAFQERVSAVVPGGMFGGGQGALNQLLVVMDGIDEPPALRRWTVSRLNTFLDALYVVPQRIWKLRLRLPRSRPAGNEIYFIGACNVPIESLDPALTRPGRMGRHIRFRTPTKDDRLDIFDRYLGKVAHEAVLDTPEARDELARMTNYYSPAMIEQVCSMALTYAHHDGRHEFTRDDIVEAMTTIESGMAVNVQYVEAETRAVALHEAGHAAASHVYSKESESTRLTIRMRGDGSLGHFQSVQKEERFSRFRSEIIARLIVTMGAIATEHVFYGQNSEGVAGDMQSVTTAAAMMVGYQAMGPERIEFPPGHFATAEEEDEARKKILDRLAEIGLVLMARGRGPAEDPLASVLNDPIKRRTAAQILGQAYFMAYVFVAHNRAQVEYIADQLVERRELHGDEVTRLLESANLEKVTVPYLEEAAWPRL